MENIDKIARADSQWLLAGAVVFLTLALGWGGRYLLKRLEGYDKTAAEQRDILVKALQHNSDVIALNSERMAGCPSRKKHE